MVSFPPCKINLGLHILSKRADGYHDLETCFFPIPWTDILEIIPSHVLTFTSSGANIPGDSFDNICLKAYHLLKKDFNIGPVKIHLHKIIPTGAGLGGGSSDAAHTLKVLNEIFLLGLPDGRLNEYASKLGSDCAFFIHNKPMLGSGRGEILSDINIDLRGKFLAIVKPNVHVSTSLAYAAVVPKTPAQDLRFILQSRAMSEWKVLLKNDFEESVFAKYQDIQEIKNSLYSLGATYACMSGSGAAVFGIFEGEIDVKNKFEGLACWSGLL